MTTPDSLWQRLLAAARRTPAPLAPPPVAPPWFAQRVVARWTSTHHPRPAETWEYATRQGLAFAMVIMLVSLLLHARTRPPQPAPWEVLATQSVLSSVMPP